MSAEMLADKSQERYAYVVPVPMGMESITARELKALGYDELRLDNGRIYFEGDLSVIPRTNLWLRTADRLLIEVGSFSALSFEALFEGMKALPWEAWLPRDARFPVLGRTRASQLKSVPDIQSVAKKAIVERLKQVYHVSWFPEEGPLYTIEVSLLKDQAFVTLDTTGPSLHKRGYRTLVSPAPLKETLAAALIYLSRWDTNLPLVDPMCGSGTIPIEAVLIGRNIAPGLRRTFAAQDWPHVPQRLWDLARKEAKDLARREKSLEIWGSDIDEKMVSMAHYHARQAGVSETIRFRTADVKKLTLPKALGTIITNPPYGERMGREGEVRALYEALSRIHYKHPDWSMVIYTAYPEFETVFGEKASKNRKLYNGRLLAYAYQYVPNKANKTSHL
ncbi:MAG: putative N6-adenine-specific DNA methylase [Candidatus Carbobacillus altaicus]|uniref:Putative N6-adenine-specific DNA methylase n=1 Tax=Candidatus Carbonibacillus altaicus TaxID=2163959 RepID=A0A2R6Y4J3_9BACL|nr:MAG: putative N6-adenine-specific DNA methylase [Candidatus Carbobacillus altaicus]